MYKTVVFALCLPVLAAADGYYDQSAWLQGAEQTMPDVTAIRLGSPGAPAVTAAVWTDFSGAWQTPVSFDNATDSVTFGLGKDDYAELSFDRPLYGIAADVYLPTIVGGLSLLATNDPADLQQHAYLDGTPYVSFAGFSGVLAPTQRGLDSGRPYAYDLLPFDGVPSAGFGQGFDLNNVEVLVPTPEPSSIGLVFFGLVAAAAIAVRRSREMT